MRITIKDLEQQVEGLNKLKFLGKYDRNTAGVFTLSQGYGGVQVHRRSDTVGCGGQSDLFMCSYITKKELYYRIVAYIKGIEDTRRGTL